MTALDLAAQISGAGPPLLILHGLFGSQRNWGGISRNLSDRLQIHGLDLRNHGDSPWSDRMDYDLMAADVAHYIERWSLGPVSILGHSMGGKVAMRLALTRPSLIRRLVVVDIAPVAYQHDHYSAYIEAMLAMPMADISRRGDADRLLAPVITDGMLRAFLLQNLVSDDGRFRWRINLPAIGISMPALIGFPDAATAFCGETLFIAGERSNYIRPRDKATVQALFPKAQLREVADSGHWPHADHPDRFLALVRPLFEA